MPSTANRGNRSLSLDGPGSLPYIPALDGLRCVAVLLVFLLHYADLKIGWIGVDIFFVLSGFLITSVLWSSRGDPHRLRSFYLRRALRIFPLYYGVLLAVLLAALAFHLPLDAERASWLLYLGNWSRYFHLGSADPLRAWDRIAGVTRSGMLLSLPVGHFWSLCIEEQFYLVWPACMYGLKTRARILVVCATLVAVMPGVRFAALHLLPAAWVQADALYHLTVFRLDALLLGALLALVLNGGVRQRTVSRVAGAALALGCATFAAFACAAYLLYGETSLYFNVPWVEVVGYTLVDLMSAAVIALICSRQSTLVRVFAVRPLRWLGRRSYGFYVFHFLVFDLTVHTAERMTLHRNVAAPAGFLLTLALTAASFRWLERPFLRLKDRVASSAPSAAPAAPAGSASGGASASRAAPRPPVERGSCLPVQKML